MLAHMDSGGCSGLHHMHDYQRLIEDSSSFSASFMKGSKVQLRD